MAKKSPLLAAEYEPPSHDEMLKDSAHRAHREVVEGWVKGEKSDEQLKRSKMRLGKILKDHK